MANERLAPDAIVDIVNLSPSTVGHLQDDPDSPDGNWLVASSNNVDTSVRVSFPSPTGNLTTGAGLQNFRILVRKQGGTGTPTVVVELWEAGSLVASSSAVNVTSATGQVVAVTWDASLLAAVSGVDVECRVAGTRSGGGPAARASVDVGAIEWNDDYVASTTHQGTGTIAGTSTASSAGTRVALGAGTIAGASTVSGAGSIVREGAGTIAGTASVAGAASLTAAGVGSAAGASTAAATGELTASGVGSSAGASTASAAGSLTVAGAGSSAGASTTTGVADLVRTGSATVAGASTATAAATMTHGASGASAGSSVAHAVDGWTPLALGPELWVDASNPATITADGGKVTRWRNKGSVSADLVGVTGPSTGTRTRNGRNILDFVRGEFLSAGDVLDLGTSDFTLVVIGIFDDVGDGAIAGKHIYGTTDGRYGLARISGSMQAIYDYGSPTFPAYGTITHKAHLWSQRVTRNGASSQHILRRGGATVSTVPFTDPGTSWNTGAEWQVGRYGSVSSLDLLGAIGEVFFVRRALTDEEVTALEQYLAAKWATDDTRWEGAGTATGTSTTTGAGTRIALGAATVSGTSTVAGAGALTASGSGTIVGASTVAGDGTVTLGGGGTTHDGTGTIAGASTASASGQSISNPPPDVANLAVWLDAADLDGQRNATLSDGGLVGTVINRGGMGGTFASEGSAPPKLSAFGGLGNRPTILFENGGLLSSLPASSFAFFTENGPWTIYLTQRSRLTNPNTIHAFVQTAAAVGASSSRGLSLFMDDRASVPRQDRLMTFLSTGGGFIYAMQSADDALPSGEWSTVVTRRVGLGQLARQWVDGVAAGTAGDVGATSLAPTLTLKIGRAESSFPHDGWITEVLIYRGVAHDDTTRADVEAWIAAKSVVPSGAVAGSSTAAGAASIVSLRAGAAAGSSTAVATASVTRGASASVAGVATADGAGVLTLGASASSAAASTATASGSVTSGAAPRTWGPMGAGVLGGGVVAATLTAGDDGVYGTGTVAGSSTATATASLTHGASASSSGSSTASATGTRVVLGAGVSTGAAVVTGAASLTAAGSGASSGSSGATGLGGVVRSGAGVSSGSSTVAGAGWLRLSGASTVSGSSTVDGVGETYRAPAGFPTRVTVDEARAAVSVVDGRSAAVVAGAAVAVSVQPGAAGLSVGDGRAIVIVQ